jgi:hypothetical protein
LSLPDLKPPKLIVDKVPPYQKRGASIFKMMDVSRHRSVDTLRGYVRDAEIFKTWDLKKRALDRPGGPGQGSDASRLRPAAAYK